MTCPAWVYQHAELGLTTSGRMPRLSKGPLLWRHLSGLLLQGPVHDGHSLEPPLDSRTAADRDATCLQGVGVLISLEELYLSQNGITAMEDLSSLTNLKILDLAQNRITKVRCAAYPSSQTGHDAPAGMCWTTKTDLLTVTVLELPSRQQSKHNPVELAWCGRGCSLTEQHLLLPQPQAINTGCACPGKSWYEHTIIPPLFATNTCSNKHALQDVQHAHDVLAFRWRTWSRRRC